MNAARRELCRQKGLPDLERTRGLERANPHPGKVCQRCWSETRYAADQRKCPQSNRLVPVISNFSPTIGGP
jgi:hypothetical protein